MMGAVLAFSAPRTRSAVVLIEKTITENGTYNAAADGADGYSRVVVNVQSGLPLGIGVGSYVFSNLNLTWSNSAEQNT